MRVEWLAVDRDRGSRRRSLVHDLLPEIGTTRCGIPVPHSAWFADEEGPEVLVCRQCLRRTSLNGKH